MWRNVTKESLAADRARLQQGGLLEDHSLEDVVSERVLDVRRLEGAGKDGAENENGEAFFPRAVQPSEFVSKKQKVSQLKEMCEVKF